MLDHARIAANAASRIQTFDIRPPDESLPSRALSGGNQQKIVIAREMGRDFTVLIAAQPTRGVDVGAIEFIHDQLRRARAEGKAILLVSADLVEILALSDRVTVMYGGRMVVTLPGQRRERGSPRTLHDRRERNRRVTNPSLEIAPAESESATRARGVRASRNRFCRRSSRCSSRPSSATSSSSSSGSHRATSSASCSKARGAMRTASVRSSTRRPR